MPNIDFAWLEQLRGHVWELAFNGKGPFAGAAAITQALQQKYPDENADALIARLCKREQKKTLAAAALTAIVSTFALPAGLPASVLASALFDARMALMVALLRGVNAHDPEVRARLEEAVHSLKGAAKSAGTAAAAAGARATWQSLVRAFVPGVARTGKALVTRNAQKRWGRRLLPVARGLPLVGSVVLATLDAPQVTDIVARVDEAIAALPKKQKARPRAKQDQNMPTKGKLRKRPASSRP